MALWTNYVTLVICCVFLDVIFGNSLPQTLDDNSTFFTTNEHNVTSNVPHLITRSDGRIAGVVAPETMKLVSRRKMELDHYESLWLQANVSGSKIEVLGTLLKKHVHKLRSVPNGKVELVFLVDSSASVGKENFFNELKFVKKLLADFTVAQWATRVAIITFSSRHRVHAVVDQLRNPSSDNNKCSLLNEELPTITYVGGGTYTKGAFQEAQAVLEYARPNASKVVFLITDGYSNGGDPRDIAENLREDGVEIFTFGIKNGNVQELLDISSVRLIEHCYILSSFEEFESLARRALHEDLEEGEYVTEVPAKCRSLCRDSDSCCHQSAVCRCGIHTGQYECVCPPGYYGTGIGGDCKPCPMETYKPTSSPGGISTCLPCPDQYHKSPPGSSNVSQCYCDEGFRSVNRNRRCEKIRCPALQRPPHGDFFGGSCDNSVNSACAITCEQGFESAGEVIRLCTESGEWTGDEFRCTVKQCDPFPVPDYGFINCTSNQYVTGTVCTSQCNEGYNLVGTRNRKCLPIAMWDGLRTSCRVVMCPPMDPIPHGRIVPSNCTDRSVPFQTGCRIRCRKGYTRIGSMITRCGSDGEWQIQGTLQGQCVDLSLPTIVCPEDIVVDVHHNTDYRNVSWEIPFVKDSTGHLPRLKVSPSVSPPWQFPIGDTTITYTAIDRAGNQNSCSFTITVTDNEPPQLEKCQSPEPVYTSNVQQAVAVEWELPVFSDNSGLVSNITTTHRSGSVMSLGATIVEYVAVDEYGNVKKCTIEVNVHESICEPPRKPTFGERTCKHLQDGGLNCTLRCKEGYSFPVETPSYFICNSDGSWFPSEVPNRDCQATYTPRGATQKMRIFYKLQNCTVDLVREFENQLSTTLYDKIDDYCGETMSCDVTTVSTLCRNNGTLQNYLNSRLNSRQQHSSNLRERRRYQEVREFVLSSSVLNLIEGPAVEVVAIINASVSRTSDSATTTKEDFDALLANLQSIPSRLDDDAKKAAIHLSGTTINGSQLLVLPEGTDPRCSDGSVIQQKGCVSCSPGMYHYKEKALCANCPVGTYQSRPGMVSCDRCPVGTSTNKPGSESVSECKALCQPGSYSLTGIEQCVSCPVGTYQPSPGSDVCISCKLNTTTVQAGSTSDEKCSAPCHPGHVSPSGLEPCLPCPMGSYQPYSQQRVCHECPANGTTQINGAVSILDCETAAGGLTRSISLMANKTDIPFSACFSFPCQNQASCNAVLSGFSCTCPPGYSGPLCEEEINECESFPCVNGTCMDLVNSFQCLCEDGFAGQLCDMNVDDCSPNPCLQNGICLDEVADFTCECPNGYEGKYCERQTNECLSNPCLNGGSCIDQLDGFYCRCHANVTGEVCSINVEECFNNSAFYHEACDNFFRNASCDNIKDYASPLCKGRIDHCSSNPCQNDGTCLNTVSGFTCLCQSGLSGELCNNVLSWDFSLIWRRQGTVDYSILKGSETFDDLYEVTVSFWMRTSDVSLYGTPFSYASDDSNDNALTLTDYSGFVININNVGDENAVVTDVNANDGLWHHIALTWRSEGGLWSLYKDGVKGANGSHLSEGRPIPGRGVFILGQEQDQLGGGFHALESFIGEIAFLNLWPRMMSDNELLNLSQSCGNPEDAVISWPAFLAGKTGDVRKGSVHFCEGCRRPRAPESGSVSNYMPGVPLLQVTYVCNHGFSVYGNERTRCQVSGDWLPPDPPQCRRVLCGYPGKLDNGNIIGYSYVYEKVIQSECWNNYVLVGSSTRTCQANGLWTGPTPVCIRSNCGRVPALENGEVEFEPGVTPDGAVTYSCNSGYQMIGNATVFCDDGGSWGILPYCERVSCLEPLDEIGVLLQFTNGTNAGDIREYSCEEGYILEGAYLRVCRDNGTWSQPIPSCRPVPCDEFLDIVHMVHFPELVLYGDMLYVRCVEGYHIDGTRSLSCGSDGSWKDPLPSCVPVTCGEPPMVTNAQHLFQNFTYGDNITVACQDGYSLLGEATLSCGPMGSWYPQPPTCTPVSCGTPPTVQNAKTLTMGILYKERVYYMCNEGFYVTGIASLECSADGTWVPQGETTKDNFDTDIEMTTCGPISCGLPPLVENSTDRGIKNITYGEEYSYECREGYQLEGSKVISCQSDGTWLPQPPMCQPISCGVIPRIFFSIPDIGGTLYGNKVIYTCQDGYRLQDGDTMLCTSMGIWEPLEGNTVPVCGPVPCGPPTPIPHAIVENSVFVFNQTFSYTCIDGYLLQGGRQVSCSSNGNWIPQPLPECQPISCGDPPVIPHSDSLVSGTTLYNTVSYSCHVGYQPEGEVILSCSTEGTWLPIPPTCQPVSCGPPQVLQNLIIEGENFTFEQNVTYHCQNGFILSGIPVIHCQADGLWSSPPPSCSPRSCGDPPSISQGLVNATGTHFGDFSNYSCVHGYYLIGINPLTCSNLGYWSPSPPSCFPISCGEVPYIENTIKMFGSYHYGERISYQCKDGFETSNDLTLTCGAHGQWEGITPVCNPVSCGEPPHIANGRVIADAYTYNSLVTYECFSGYTTMSQGLLRCDMDQAWKGHVSECQPIDCGQPKQIYHGRAFFNLTTFRQKVRYECSEGYDLIGKNFHHCLATGMWSDTRPVCRPVFCGQPPSIENGRVIGENFHFNQTVTFRCISGYRLSGGNSSECTASRQWSNPSPLCLSIECPQLVPPDNGYIQNLSVSFGTTARYACLPGYILQGSDTRSCGEDGFWSGLEVSCAPIDCGMPPELANATVSLTGQTLHHKAEYMCLEGFDQNMQVSLICHEDGSWTSIPKGAICEPVKCLPPPSIQNGDYLGANLEYNSTITYECDPGHNLVGSASLICSESGWIPSNGAISSNLPSCQIVSCGPPPSVQNGYSSTNGTTYGETAELFCMKGYDLLGLNYVTCLTTGQWDEPSASCQPITCTPPVTQNHAILQPQKQTYAFMEAVTYGCQEGYTLRGDETINCVGMNSWNGSTPFCAIVSCGDPPRLAMGSVEYDSTLFGSEAFYSCYAGFKLNGTMYLQCLPDGSWSKPSPVCHAVSCGSSPDIPHGYHTQGDFIANDTVRYLCQTGYSLAGSDIRKCSPSGVWIGPLPRCYPIQCPSLDNPAHGQVYHDGTTFSAKASYFCDTGYVLHGIASRICQATGNWSYRKPSCFPRTCSEPPSFSSAFIENTTSSMSLYVYQTTVTYQCQPGFTLVTENTITCSAHGTWEPPLVICQPVECPPPTLTKGLSYTSDGMHYGSTLVFSCLGGYIMNGTSLVTCTEGGVWSHSSPSCEKIRCPAITTPQDGRFSTEGTYYQDTAKFVCNDGYHLHGEVEINCTAQGTWSAPAPTCKPMVCLKPPDIEHGIPLIDKLYSTEDTIFYKCMSGYSLEGTKRRRCQQDGTWTGGEPSCKRSQTTSRFVKTPPGCILPCLHGGQCVGHYQCECRYGFTGSRCETVLCMPRCFNGAKCVGRYPECRA